MIKVIVHRAPKADPYDVLTVEGAVGEIAATDLDNDGRPELFVDTVIGAHTHQVSVYTLNTYNRFQEVHGSPLYADWGPVRIDPDTVSGAYRISLLRGRGAAGKDAKPVIYILKDKTLEEIDVIR